MQRVKALEGELQSVTANVNSQMMSKDDLIKQLQDQVTLWRNKYETLAKLYSQLRTEHLDMLAKFKPSQPYFGLRGGWLTFWVTVACATDMMLFGYDQGVFGNSPYPQCCHPGC